MFNYFANTDKGNIFLTIDLKDQERNSSTTNKQSILNSIESLRRCERILQGIEDWLGCGLDIMPINGLPSLSIKMKVDATEKLEEDEISSLIVMTDKETIIKIAKEKNHISNDINVSGSLTFTVMLDEMKMKEMDYQLLKTRSTLLIPASFNQEWPINLLSNDDPIISYKAKLNSSGSMLNVNIENTRGYGKEDLLDNNENCRSINVRIVSKNLVNLPIQIVLSPESTSLDLEYYINNQKCELIVKSKSIAEGNLIPLADGYGVILEDIKK